MQGIIPHPVHFVYTDLRRDKCYVNYDYKFLWGEFEKHPRPSEGEGAARQRVLKSLAPPLGELARQRLRGHFFSAPSPSRASRVPPLPKGEASYLAPPLGELWAAAACGRTRRHRISAAAPFLREGTRREAVGVHTALAGRANAGQGTANAARRPEGCHGQRP